MPELPKSDSALLIDDDVEFCAMLQEYLGRHGWDVAKRHSGRTGFDEACAGAYDLVLLDVMLPDLDGFEVLRRLRQRSSTIPVLLLTARGEEIDRIVGLELGADDYLPKPFSPRELLARMRAVVRRSGLRESAPVEASGNGVEGFTLDLQRREIFFGSQLLDLTDLEYLLLRKLIEHPYEIVSRQELTEQVLERPFRPLDRGIDMLFSRLRRKLDTLDGFHGNIKTVRNSGYIFLPSPEPAG